MMVMLLPPLSEYNEIIWKSVKIAAVSTTTTIGDDNNYFSTESCSLFMKKIRDELLRKWDGMEWENIEKV